MVGENDIKGLFIYSIDEEIPGNAVIKIKKNITIICNNPIILWLLYIREMLKIIKYEDMR